MSTERPNLDDEARASLVPAVPEGRRGLTEDERRTVDRYRRWISDPELDEWERPTEDAEKAVRRFLAIIDRLASLPAVPSEGEREGEVVIDGKRWRVERCQWSGDPSEPPHHFLYRLVPVPPATRSETEEVNDGDLSGSDMPSAPDRWGDMGSMGGSTWP